MTASDGTPLQCGYSFWYMRRGKGVSAANKTNPANSDGEGAATIAPAADQPQQQPTAAVPNPYENSIKTINTIKTVEEFWGTYNYLMRPNDLPTTTDYHFFRQGIKPTWEDASNAKGGKWILRLRKGLASRYWEEAMLALIGGQYSGVPEGEICGVVISIRYNEDILGIWNKTNDLDMTTRIRDAVRKVLQLPPQATMEYKPHQTALADKSSFRNATSMHAWKSSGKPNNAMLERAQSHGGEVRRGSTWGERDHGKPKSSRDSDRAWR